MIKPANKTVSLAMKKAITETPEKVKQAVIDKWLKYMKQIFSTKILMHRKTLNNLGFRNYECFF